MLNLIISAAVTVGSFQWENGVKDSRVIFNPNRNGRFQISWVPPKNLTKSSDTKE